jgi:hypothetical protein
MTKLVLAATIALAVSTTALAQTPEGVALLKTLPADGTTLHTVQIAVDSAKTESG